MQNCVCRQPDAKYYSKHKSCLESNISELYPVWTCKSSFQSVSLGWDTFYRYIFFLECYLKWKSRQQSPNALQALSQKQVLWRDLLSSKKHLCSHDWSLEFLSRSTARSSFVRFLKLKISPLNLTIKSLTFFSESGKR